MLLGNYNREPLVFEKGRGSYLFDPSGVAYLDFLGGIAIHVLGHCHPGITHAIQKQAQRMVHVSNLYYNPAVVDLAELLVEKTFADRVFSRTREPRQLKQRSSLPDDMEHPLADLK